MVDPGGLEPPTSPLSADGITSHEVIKIVRKRLNIKKVGHAGTLDPLATGLLIVMLGKTTKLSNLLISQFKSYQTEMELFIETDSGDITAIKIAGKKLYEYARQGKEIEVSLRQVEVKKIELLEYNSEKNIISLQVECSKGTYIRSLVKDIAQRLATIATVTSLRRISSGSFHISQAIKLEEIRPEKIISHQELSEKYKESQQKYNTKEKRAEIKGLLVRSAKYQNEDVDEFPLFQISSIPREDRHYLNTSLTGQLDLTDFINLEKLVINDQRVTRLIISNCANLSILDCSNNYLEDLDLTNLSQLKIFACANNQITNLDLSPLTSEKLENNDNEGMIRQGKYNRFYGSLEFLSTLEKLEELDISGTDISSGLEYSPPNLKFFFCAEIRAGARVKEIKKELCLNENQAQSKETEINWAKSSLLKFLRNSRILKELIQSRVGNEIEPLLSNFLRTQQEIKIMQMSSQVANDTGFSQFPQNSVMIQAHLDQLASLKQELLSRQVSESEINQLYDLQSPATEAKILLMALRQSELLKQQSQIIQVNLQLPF
ncbi:12253_t:CDS:2 [Ambispora leptoticha]|uniref:tRNA pseudouridine(55) synthase n=1 Tax=Ambispora leptoticha TaxID=144679 RepID=A0A9N8VTU9_9GLOM|nr:12253_t:CDS:2 [Ambispora leptoticha]